MAEKRRKTSITYLSFCVMSFEWENPDQAINLDLYEA